MEKSAILKADLLDIVFEGRNKAYGAYQLRKTYNRRMIKALLATAATCVLMFGGYFLSNAMGGEEETKNLLVKDMQLEDIKPQEKEPEPLPPPPPPKPPDPPKMEMKKFTDFKIVKDEEVKDDERPPEMKELEEVKIGTINQEGVKDEGIVAPPADVAGKGIVDAPKKVEEDWDKTFTKVEIESKYPGGDAAWMRYLNKNLSYPQDAADNEIQGVVVVQFIVDKDGVVSEVQAVSGPKELHNEAVRVIRKSGKWTPAIQNGRQVKSYKKQPIYFKLLTN